MAKTPPHDLTGRTFGRLTVISKAPKTGKNVHWLCVCRCNDKKAIRADHLLRGITISCGCAREGPQETHHHKGMRWGGEQGKFTKGTPAPARTVTVPPPPLKFVSDYGNTNAIPFSPPEDKTFKKKLTREQFEFAVKSFRSSGFSRAEAEEMVGMGAEITD